MCDISTDKFQVNQFVSVLNLFSGMGYRCIVLALMPMRNLDFCSSQSRVTA